MSSGIDALDTLTEKLKQNVNEIQERYESFIDSNRLYKQGKVNEKDFFASIGDYLVASTALNFNAVKTIFEMKSLVEKKPSIHNQPGNHPSTSESQTTVGEQYSLPKPQQPKFSPLQAADAQTSINGSGTTPKVAKECIVCKKLIPMQAKFCSRCGNSQ